MNTVNYGEQYNHRVTLRLNDSQFNFLVRASNLLGVTPSDYLRMTINSAYKVSVEKTPFLFSDSSDNLNGGTSNENVKTDCNNQL